ncbi:MAG: RHS repeat domain-containing protein, partial [Candidatus Methylomirabilis sp.]
SVHPIGIPPGQTRGVAGDGSHLRLTAIPDNTDPTSYTVEFPDGTTHTFSKKIPRPVPTPAGSSYDFTNLDENEVQSSQTGKRFGLTTVDDSFGNHLLQVCYAGQKGWEFTSMKLGTNSCSASVPTINFTWTDRVVGPNPSVTWRVLDSITFPSPSGTQLKVAFAYSDGTFSRNTYDNSNGEGPCTIDSGDLLQVPELASMTFSDPATSSITTFSYQFSYYQAADANQTQKQGALQSVTLPSLGSIAYDYRSASGGFVQLEIQDCDEDTCPEIACGDTTPEPLVPGALGELRQAIDKSPAVCTRTETDPSTGRSSTTTYTRRSFFHCLNPCNLQGLNINNLLRRVTITSPGNDDGSGPAQYSTRYFFHTAHPDDEAQGESNGLELERRDFPGSDTSAAPVRMSVSCYANVASCYRSEYIHAVERRPSPDVQVVWYGSRPTSSDGSSCPGVAGDAQCTKTNNTNYNAVAGKFKDVNVFSSIPGSINRTIETDWTASSQSQPDWLLDLYDRRFTWDGSSLPAGSNGQSVVRQYADFDSTNGFLKGSWTWDSVLSKAIKNCGYNNGNGTVSGAFSQTYTASSEPITDSCPGSMPSVGTDNDSFGKGHTWTNLLLTRSNWKKGTASIGWNSFDVVRDSNTGQITTSKDPNSALTTAYTYDALGRIKSITPPGGELATTISYDSTTQTTVSRGLGSSVTWQRYLYDGLGSLSCEIRQMPSGYAVRTHTYDSAGHANFVSEWFNQGAISCPSASLGTTSSNFDPFGRPQTITKADGKVTTIDRTDGSILFSDWRESVTVNVGGSNPTTVTRKDILGRVINVAEPSVGQGGDLTTYSYNVLDKLACVKTGASPDMTNCTSNPNGQYRAFTYDAFGFLRSEKTPEKSNAAVTYGPYGTLGNVLTETQPGSLTLTRTYDAAGRLTGITSNETGSPRYLTNSLLSKIAGLEARGCRGFEVFRVVDEVIWDEVDHGFHELSCPRGVRGRRNCSGGGIRGGVS